MGAHVLAPRPTEIIVSIGNIDDASAASGPTPPTSPPIGFHLSHVPVSLDQHTPAPAPGLDAGLDAGCVEPAVEELSRRVESAPTWPSAWPGPRSCPAPPTTTACPPAGSASYRPGPTDPTRSATARPPTTSDSSNPFCPAGTPRSSPSTTPTPTTPPTCSPWP